jgi:hypothetical protein
MSRTTRRIIFYLFVLIFLLVGVGLTLYAQGYRVSGRSLAVTTVGGLYITTSPSGASITLDGKHVDSNSGLFQKGTLLNGLFPSNHSLELAYPGYKPWKRTVSVLPSKVTEITNAILVPETSTVFTTSTPQAFWLAGTDLLLQTASGTLTSQSSTVVGGTPVGFDQSHTQFLSLNRKDNSYSMTNLVAGVSTPLKPLLAQIPSQNHPSSTVIMIDDSSESRVFAITPRVIFWMDTERGTITPLISPIDGTSTVGTVSPARNTIAWSLYSAASSTSQIVIYDKFSKRASVLPQVIPGAITAIHWGGTLLSIITDRHEFFLIDLDRQITIERRSDVRDTYFSNDATWLAILGNTSIEVLSFTAPKQYTRFSIKDIGSVSRITWYKNNHGFFIYYPNEVKLLEVDDALQENITSVASGTQATYDPDLNRLYYLTTQGISFVQFPEKQ